MLRDAEEMIRDRPATHRALPAAFTGEALPLVDANPGLAGRVEGYGYSTKQRLIAEKIVCLGAVTKERLPPGRQQRLWPVRGFSSAKDHQVRPVQRQGEGYPARYLP